MCREVGSIRTRVLVFFCLLFFTLLSDPSRGSDPLEVLCTGHTGSMPLMAAVLGREPMTDAVIIPTRIHGVTEVTSSTVRRYMRLYFPRSYQELTEKYEFLLLRGIDCYYFTTTQLEWMRRAIEEVGLGGLQDRSVVSSTSGYSLPWAESTTSEAFPNDADAVVAVDYSRHGYMEVILNDDQSLPDIFTPYMDLLHYQVGSGGIHRDDSQGGVTNIHMVKDRGILRFRLSRSRPIPPHLGLAIRQRIHMVPDGLQCDGVLE